MSVLLHLHKYMNHDILSALARRMEQSPQMFFVRNGHMTILLLIGCVVGGVFALSTMPIESAPEVKIPIGIVSTTYPGASPADVEKLVTDELEDQLKNLDDVKQMTSDSIEGVSTIVVEFEADADVKESMRELRDEIDTAKADLPSEVEDDPIVNQVRADDRPIVTFAIVGTVPMQDFKEHADELQDRLEGISGVDDVTIAGLPEREMQVLINRRKLEGFSLSITDVTQAIANNHIDIPVGSLRTDDLYYQASLKAQFDSPQQLRRVVVASRENQNIFLRDIAQVREVFAETSSETRLFTSDTGTYRQTVTLDVFKKVGEDLVTIVGTAKEIVEAYRKELPRGMDIIITDDESDRIWEDISRLLRSAWQTVLIIALTLFLALGFKEAVAAASSIPLLYLIALVGLALMGSTFNFLTFFALILSLGVVVDTSIVIIEGMHENMQRHNMTAKDAALASVASFRAPLISGTLTTLAAFLPLGLMTGIMGEYVKHIPITVNLTLIASLLTALMILPALAVWLLRGAEERRKPALLAPSFHRLGRWYAHHINRILASSVRRRLWLCSMVIAFLLSGALFATGIVKFQLFAAQDINVFFVNVDLPEGSSLEKTKEVTERVETILEGTPELIRFMTVYGGGGSTGGPGTVSSGAPHKARITVTLTDPSQRPLKSFHIAKELRSKLRVIQDADVLVEELSSGPPTGADIEVRLLGDDVRTLEQFSATVEKTLREIPGAIDVSNNLELSPGEYHLRPKRDRLEFFGTSAVEIGQILRTAVFGDENVKITRGGEETDIAVRIDFRDQRCLRQPIHRLLERRDNITICRSNPRDSAELLNLLVPTDRGQVPVSELVDVELTSAVTTIRHFNTDRVVSVKASVDEGYVLQDVLHVLRTTLSTMDMPENVRIEFGGENEDTEESMRSLGRASIIAILLIFGILVYQFQSFRQVFIVFSTMPLAVMGVLYGLALIQIPLSFPGMIGMVALLGIVVNDAIVLIDKINQNRKHTVTDGLTDLQKQQKLIEAVEQGCRQRLEPVIMTTLTTALGVTPLIFTGETFRDLAIVLAIGITIATIFTLVVIPVLYVVFESRRGRGMGSWWKRTSFPPMDGMSNQDEDYVKELQESARRVNMMQDGPS